MMSISVWPNGRPRGLMDKASDFGSEDWGFESLRGHIFSIFIHLPVHISKHNWPFTLNGAHCRGWCMFFVLANYKMITSNQGLTSLYSFSFDDWIFSKLFFVCVSPSCQIACHVTQIVKRDCLYPESEFQIAACKRVVIFISWELPGCWHVWLALSCLKIIFSSFMSWVRSVSRVRILGKYTKNHFRPPSTDAKLESKLFRCLSTLIFRQKESGSDQWNLDQKRGAARSLQPSNSEISPFVCKFTFFCSLQHTSRCRRSFRLFQYKQISVYIFTKILRKRRRREVT